jgi:protein TonB
MKKALALSVVMLTLSASAFAQDVFLPADGITKPVALKTAKPAYTPEAMLARISGDVTLQIDVMADGTVGTVALVKGLDPALDREAVKAAKQFSFKPGTKDGEPVAVRIEVTLNFSMR